MCWVVGVLLLYKARTRLPWMEEGELPGGQQVRSEQREHTKDRDARNKRISTHKTLTVFAVASVITLIAGVALEQSGEL